MMTGTHTYYYFTIRIVRMDDSRLVKQAAHTVYNSSRAGDIIMDVSRCLGQTVDQSSKRRKTSENNGDVE